jgi:cytochrome c oxidase subunit 1
MNKLKAYHIFWMFGLLSLIISLIEYFLFEDSILDINVHDTYYVIAHFDISIFRTILFLILGGVYYFFKYINFKLIPSLTKIHIGITCFSLIAYYLGDPIINLLQSNNSDFPLFNDESNYNIYISLLILIVVVAQLLFILNILFSTIRHFLRRW